jgi:hypothetical protein
VCSSTNPMEALQAYAGWVGGSMERLTHDVLDAQTNVVSFSELVANARQKSMGSPAAVLESMGGPAAVLESMGSPAAVLESMGGPSEVMRPSMSAPAMTQPSKQSRAALRSPVQARSQAGPSRMKKGRSSTRRSAPKRVRPNR